MSVLLRHQIAFHFKTFSPTSARNTCRNTSMLQPNLSHQHVVRRAREQPAKKVGLLPHDPRASPAAEHDLEQLSRPSLGRPEIGRDLSCDPLSSRCLPRSPPSPSSALYRQTFISGPRPSPHPYRTSIRFPFLTLLIHWRAESAFPRPPHRGSEKPAHPSRTPDRDIRQGDALHQKRG